MNWIKLLLLLMSLGLVNNGFAQSELGKVLSTPDEPVRSLSEQSPAFQDGFLALEQEVSKYSAEQIRAHEQTVEWVKNHPEEFKQQFNSALSDRVPEKYRHMLVELGYVQIMMAGVIGLIASLPEDVSNWDMDELGKKSLGARWSEHVKAGPVWDKDDWAINYVGHPLSGSAYYMWGRTNGLSWKESALLSTLMSTFFWEYGYEAFAEIPSIQDLIFTPLIGSLIGEGAFYLYNRVMANGGKIGNSKVLGNIARGVLNPIGELNNHLDNLLSGVTAEWDLTAPTHLRTHQRMPEEGYIGVKFRYEF